MNVCSLTWRPSVSGANASPRRGTPRSRDQHPRNALFPPFQIVVAKAKAAPLLAADDPGLNRGEPVRSTSRLGERDEDVERFRVRTIAFPDQGVWIIPRIDHAGLAVAAAGNSS